MKKIIALFIASFVCSIFLPQAWATIDDGLVGYWPFNGNANDESGNGNDGIVHDAILTSDRFGNPDSAYDLDESNGNIKVTKVVNFPIFKNATISFWADHDATCPDSFCTMYSESEFINGNTSFCIQYGKGNRKLALHSYVDGVWIAYAQTSFTIPMDGSWHHYLAMKTTNSWI